MTKVIVKCVKFGDSFSILNSNNRLIVDCGSANRDGNLNARDFAYSKIKNEIADNTEKQLLITHYDIDHYNGILSIPDYYKQCFKEIYLPYSIIDKKYVFSKTISRLLLIAPPKSWGFRLSKSIIKLLQKIVALVSDTKKIYMLHGGSNFMIGRLNNCVLWPDIDIENININYENKNCLIKNIDDDENNEFINLIERLTIYIDNSFEEIITSVDKLENLIDEYFNVINRNNLNEGDGITSELITLIQLQENTVLRYHDYIWRDMDEVFGEQIKLWSRAKYHRLINCMNAISVVFQCKDPAYIFMGDLPKPITQYISHRFLDNYKLVKVPHHGTSNYYSDNIPDGEYYIISNGGYVRRKVSEKWIERVIKKGKDGLNQTILCTNAHNSNEYCYYAYLNATCCTKYCTKINNCYDIKL